MTFPEWFLEYELHSKNSGNYAGGLKRGDIDDIEDWLEDLEAEGK